MNNIKLGNIVRDASTGFTGTATMFSTYLGGVKHCTIQPECDSDGRELPRSESFDYHLIDFVSDGIADRVHPQDDGIHVSLGQRCRDKVTGLVGIAVLKLESLQGCVQFGITPLMSTEPGAKYPDSVFFDYKRLEVLDPTQAVTIPESTSGCINAPAVRGDRIRRG